MQLTVDAPLHHLLTTRSPSESARRVDRLPPLNDTAAR